MKAENGASYSLRGWLAFAALAVLSLIGANAHARITGHAVDLLWNQQGGMATATATGSGSTPLTFKPTSSGGAEATGKKGLPWPGKSQAMNMANWKMSASAGNMAKSLITPLGVATMVGAPILKQLADSACVRLLGGEFKEGAVWDQCVFTPTNQDQWKTNLSNNDMYRSSREAACDARVQYLTANSQIQFSTVKAVTSTGGEYNQGLCSYDVWWKTGQSAGQYVSTGSESFMKRVAVIDVQTGWAPAGSADVETKLTAKVKEWCQSDFTAGLSDGKCAEVAASIATPNIGLLIDQSSIKPCQLGVNWTCPAEVTGPASAEKSTSTKTTTKTNPDGTTTTTVVTTTITNNYNYDKDTVTNKETTKVTTTENGITSEQVTTNEEVTPPEEDTREDLCKVNPEASACKELDKPEEVEVPKSSKDVVYEPEDLGWGSGSCPAPFGWTDSLGSHSINLQPYCEKITGVVRPVVLLLAALMALAIALPAIKE